MSNWSRLVDVETFEVSVELRNMLGRVHAGGANGLGYTLTFLFSPPAPSSPAAAAAAAA